MRMVRACAEHERTEIILRSTRMGFLTGTRLTLYRYSPTAACPGSTAMSTTCADTHLDIPHVKT